MDFHCRSRSPHSTVHVTSLITLFLTDTERPSHYAISLVLTCAKLCLYIYASKKKKNRSWPTKCDLPSKNTLNRSFTLAGSQLIWYFFLSNQLAITTSEALELREFLYEHYYVHGSTWTVFKTVYVEQFGPLNKTLRVVHRTRLHFCLSSTGQFEGIIMPSQ